MNTQPYVPTDAEQIEANYRTRPIELSRLVLGAPIQAGVLANEEVIIDSITTPTSININTNEEVNLLIQEASTAGNLIGLFLALGLTHLIARFVRFPVRTSVSAENGNAALVSQEDIVPLDPLYRSVKTLACFGQAIGMTLGLLIPVSFGRKIASNLLGAVIGFGFGILGIGLYFAKKLLTKHLGISFEWANWRFATDGWTKYAKTALVMGTVLGGSVFGIIFLSTGGGLANITTSIAIGGGIVGSSFFVLAIVFTPLISQYASNLSKFDYRSNYTRAGTNLGSAIGAIIGFAIIYSLGWGLSSALAALSLGSVIGATIGGPLLSILGRHITPKFQAIDPNTGAYKDTDNSWDYSLRILGTIFGSLFTFIGCFIGNSSAAGNVLPVVIGFAWPAFLGACGTLFGCGVGLLVVYVARKLQPDEEKTRLPYTQLMMVAYAWGAGLCAVAGLAYGMLSGYAVVDLTICILKGSSLGGFLGGGGAGLIGSAAARKVWGLLYQSIRDGFKHLFFKQEPPAPPGLQNGLNHLPPANVDMPIQRSPRPVINTQNISVIESKYDNTPPSMSTKKIRVILQKNPQFIEVVEEPIATRPKELTIIPNIAKNMHHSCMFSSKIAEQTVLVPVTSPAPAA